MIADSIAQLCFFLKVHIIKVKTKKRKTKIEEIQNRRNAKSGKPVNHLRTFLYDPKAITKDGLNCMFRGKLTSTLLWLNF